jgi:hypothetical protein
MLTSNVRLHPAGYGKWRYPHTAPKRFNGASLVPEEDSISKYVVDEHARVRVPPCFRIRFYQVNILYPHQSNGTHGYKVNRFPQSGKAAACTAVRIIKLILGQQEIAI